MIKAYTGKNGSGKTFYMVKEAKKHYLAGRDIYSNTVLDFDGFLSGKPFFTLFERFLMLFGKQPIRGRIVYFQHITDILEAHDGLILFDEASALFNSRNWESLPDEFIYKLQQHRKHRLDLICTTPNLASIDISYRRLIHSWTHCKCFFSFGSPHAFIAFHGQYIKDVDFLYTSVDDLQVPDLSIKFSVLGFWTRAFYDTMYDIGFNKFKSIWLNYYEPMKSKSKQMFLIIPKKMSSDQALKVWSSYRLRLSMTK